MVWAFSKQALGRQLPAGAVVVRPETVGDYPVRGELLPRGGG